MRIFPRAFYVVFSVASVSLSISADVAAQRRQLVGSWRFEDPKRLICVMRFRDDGTFGGFVAYEQQPKIEISGTWNCQNGAIFYRYEAPKDAKDVDEIIELTATYYVIRNQTGEVHRYNRLDDR